MDENRVVKLNTEINAERKREPLKKSPVHTNPLLQMMFRANLLGNPDKRKFKLSDLFK